jgi:hypothetical protein
MTDPSKPQPTALRHAFKEWAVICRALASGRQAVILRKGGIAEDGGAFRVERDRFWLYPTFVHQQADGVVPQARPLLDEALADRPPEGTLRLSHFADVAGVWRTNNLGEIEKLAGLHCWSGATVRARFAYRRPGLFVLAVRVRRVPRPLDLPEAPRYGGCKSWVELEQDLPTDGAAPVLEDDPFAAVVRTLHRLFANRVGN